VDVRSINNPICHLAECPIWNDAEKALYWTDILERRIWRYDPGSGEIRIEWQGDAMVGGFAFTGNNDMVLCTEKGIYRLARQSDASAGSSLRLLYGIPMAADERFNDITTDPRGRIFAGTLTARREQGILYRLEKDRPAEVVLSDIGTSNGMTFSLDLKYFYHTDSHVRTITRYDYDLDTGDIANPCAIYKAAEANGVPDGITMDAEGHIWIACWRGRKVIRIDSAGQIVSELPIPAVQISSVAFGGDDMNELYVTTACEGGADLARGLDESGRYLGGEVFCAHLDAVGRKEWPADF
jgi:D-xylonolactonase